MSKPKHTPGPWRTGDMYNTVFGPPNGQPSPKTIATIQCGSHANARLIAAAPDMLEALGKLVFHLRHPESSSSIAKDSWYIEGFSLMDAAEQAIAKAKGE